MGGGPPGFPPGFTCPVVLWILLCQKPFRLQDYYLLWCVFPYTSAKNFESRPQSATPKVLLPLVWPLSLSLAATKKIDVSFSSSAYLDVSVQRVYLRTTMDSLHGDWVLPSRVAPFGNLRINTYLRFPVAYRSLSRPSSAPDAKASALCSY